MVEEFEVDPSFLDGYSGQMARAGWHMTQIEGYTRTQALEGLGHMDLEGWPLEAVFEAVYFFAEERRRHYDTLATRIAESSRALRATSDRYRKTEKAVQERMDMTYPSAPDQHPILPPDFPAGLRYGL